MAAYKDLVGQKITKVTSNPGEPKTGQMWYNSTDGKLRGLGILEAFSSAANLTTARNTGSSFGTQTAGVIGLGGTPPGGNSDATEEYNGSGWSTGNNANTARRYLSGFGIETAGVACGGFITASSAATEEYDGSSWTSGNNLNTGRYFLASAGILTAGVAFGGNVTPFTAATEEYDGTNWTNVTSMSTARGYLGGTGLQTAALACGGYTGSNTAATEEYDGTSWTAGGNLNSAKRNVSAGGIQTDGQAFGGGGPSSTTAFEKYDGTSWSTSPLTLTTARQGAGSSGQPGSQTANVITGGSGATSVTEEYNKSTNAVTAAAWASGGNINEARRAFGSCGSNTAGLIFGGRLSPTASPPAGYRGQTEQYDGTSWTEVGDLNNTRSNVGGAGTQTTAVAFGGLNPSLGPRPADNVEEWDGSSWTNVTDVPTGSENYGSCGIQTAALQYGGSAPPGMLTTTLEYDGTNWTSGGAMNTGRNLYSGSGTQTAALGAGGQEPSLSSKTEEYDGTSWSEVNNMNRAAFYSSSTSAPQTDSMSFGSGPSVNYVEKYDGTTWSTAPTLGTSRSDGSGFGTSANGSVMVGGPSGPSTYPSATEEFTGETTTGNIADFTTS